MAFMSIFLMGAMMMLIGMIILGVLSLKGLMLLIVGIVFLKRSKKEGKRIAVPVVAIVFGGIFLIPLVLFILLWMYGSVTNLVMLPEYAAAILRI